MAGFLILLFASEVSANERKAVDPVCGMKVNVDTAEKKGLVVEYKGKKYYFCMKGDMEKFKKEPQKYIRKKGDTCAELDKEHELLMKSFNNLEELNEKLKRALRTSEQKKLINQFIKEAGNFFKLVERIHDIIMEEMEGVCEMGKRKMHHMH